MGTLFSTQEERQQAAVKPNGKRQGYHAVIITWLWHRLDTLMRVIGAAISKTIEKATKSSFQNRMRL